MNIVKPDNLALLTTVCRLEGTLSLSVAAMACFCLDAPAAQPILPETELWQTAMAALAEGDVLDMGLPKPGGEFIVHGAACAHHPTSGMEITVRVGNLSKTLMVTGDRSWTATGAPGVPAAFTRMPITWHNAFGGPGYAFNPVGKGYRSGADGRHPMPNIQPAGQPMASPGETPLPAGFGPYPAAWRQRQSLLGHFDHAWLTGRWPDLPRDASPLYFHTAPEDQRLQKFFRGDEPLYLAGMHPEKSVIASALPGLRARIFVEQAMGEEKKFIEVQTRAETLMLYPEALRAILLFRGVIPVADEGLDDITCLTADWEQQSEAPRPIEHYLERMQAALKPSPAPEMAIPTLPEPAEAAQLPAESAAPSPLPKMEALDRELAEMETESDRRLGSLGVSREELLRKYGAEDDTASVCLEDLAREIERLEKTNDEGLRQLGMSREALLAKYCPAENETAPAALSALPDKVKELLAQSAEQLRAAGLTEAEAWHGLPREIVDETPSAAMAQETIARWEQETVKKQIIGEEADRADLPPGRSVLNAAEVIERHRAGASLRGIDASDADFSGADLQGADFGEAILDKACFAGANLRQALFASALLSETNFRGADLSAAVLNGATGTASDFTEARLIQADLSTGDWTDATLARADLHDANLSGAILRRADLSGCALQGAVAAGTDFTDGNLSEADLRDCDLTGADCSGADLSKAILAGVRADGLQLFGARAEMTDLRNACLRGVRGGAGTRLTGTRLSGADLSGAALGGAQLDGADLEGAALDGSDFSRACFERTNLRNATARGSSFMKAIISQSDLRGIDLLQGSLRHAKLEKVDLRDASLYGVDFFGAALKATDTRGANVKGTLLTLMTPEKGAK